MVGAWYEITTWAELGKSRTSIYKFYVNVERGQYSTFIKIGLPKPQPCVHIVADHEHDWSELMYLQHRDDCSSNRLLKKGQNGTVLMLYAALSMLKHLFPHITKVEFQDSSKVFCEAINEELDLQLFKLLTQGNTWYQKILPITLKDSYYQERFDETVRILNSPPTVPWSIVNRFMEAHHEKDVYQYFIKEVKEIYMNASTLKDVFRQWYLLFGCAFFVIEMYNLLQIFDLLNVHNLHWVIDLESAMEWSTHQTVQLESIKPPKTPLDHDVHIKLIGSGMKPFYWTNQWKTHDHLCQRGSLSW